MVQRNQYVSAGRALLATPTGESEPVVVCFTLWQVVQPAAFSSIHLSTPTESSWVPSASCILCQSVQHEAVLAWGYAVKEA